MELDHLVIATHTLEEGTAFVERIFATPTQPGGQHARMGTHNRLLNLGNGVYLEIIAIDPNGSAPEQPRWFALDRPELWRGVKAFPVTITEGSLELSDHSPIGQISGALYWVARSLNIESDVSNAVVPPGPIQPMSRGDFKWRIAIPEDGVPPLGGIAPGLIQWDIDDHPTNRLADVGLALHQLTGWHPELDDITSFADNVKIGPLASRLPPLLEAVVSTPNGMIVIGS